MICITLERWNERTRVASIEVSFRFVRSRARRAVIDVVFYDAARSEICRRSGMRLVSKAGREYEVCRRDPETAQPRLPTPSIEDVCD